MNLTFQRWQFFSARGTWTWINFKFQISFIHPGFVLSYLLLFSPSKLPLPPPSNLIRLEWLKNELSLYRGRKLIVFIAVLVWWIQNGLGEGEGHFKLAGEKGRLCFLTCTSLTFWLHSLLVCGIQKSYQTVRSPLLKRIVCTHLYHSLREAIFILKGIIIKKPKWGIVKTQIKSFQLWKTETWL